MFCDLALLDPADRRAQSLEHGQLADCDAVQVRRLHLLLFFFWPPRRLPIRGAPLWRWASGLRPCGPLGVGWVYLQPETHAALCGTRASRRRLRRQNVRFHQPRGDRFWGTVPADHRLPDRRHDLGAGGAPLQRAVDQPRRDRTRADQPRAVLFTQCHRGGFENDEPLKQVRTQNVAVLFADIVDFTAYADGRSPMEVIGTLRLFHKRMEREVFRHGGTLDKYLGDGLMATFGTPFASNSDAVNALRCAQAMIGSIDELKPRPKKPQRATDPPQHWIALW